MGLNYKTFYFSETHVDLDWYFWHGKMRKQGWERERERSVKEKRKGTGKRER